VTLEPDMQSRATLGDVGAVLPPYDPHTLGGAPAPDRDAAYGRLHAEAPVLFSAELQAWIVTRYADVRRILGDREHFKAAGSIGIDAVEAFPSEVRQVFERGFDRFPGIIEMDPPRHTRYRNLVDHAFKARRVATMEPAFRAIAEELVGGFVAEGAVDLVPAFAIPYPLAVMCHLLGVPAADVPEVHRMSAGFTALEAGTITRLPLAEQVAAAERFVAFQHYAADLVRARREHPREDLISALVSAELAGERPITLEEAISTIIHLLFAGHETNARSLASTVHLLLSDRRRWEAIVADPARIPGVVEEGLRLEPPVTYHTRTTTRPVVVGDVEIPAGAVVHLVFAAANRDADVFADPAAFDAERENVTRHLGFGWGIHHCVGAPVARLESRVALEVLAARLPDLRLRSPHVMYEQHSMLRGLAGLPVEWGIPSSDN
jgi:cytochrome P450